MSYFPCNVPRFIHNVCFNDSWSHFSFLYVPTFPPQLRVKPLSLFPFRFFVQKQNMCIRTGGWKPIESSAVLSFGKLNVQNIRQREMIIFPHTVTFSLLAQYFEYTGLVLLSLPLLREIRPFLFPLVGCDL